MKGSFGPAAVSFTVVLLRVPPLVLVLVDVPQTSGPGHVTGLIDRLASGHVALGHWTQGSGPWVVCKVQNHKWEVTQLNVF